MPVIPPSLKATAALITVAVTASSLAYVLYFKLVDEIGPTKALTTEFMVPVVAVIIGYLLLDETMTMNQLLGATIIITGCALVMGFVPKRFKKSDELHVTDLEVG
jgi:drug/metabolite transporter (DMT)-like permease